LWPELREILANTVESLGTHEIEPALRLGPDLHEACFLENAQVVGDRLLAGLDVGRDLVDRPRVAADE
jgi:hypothetical protein